MKVSDLGCFLKLYNYVCFLGSNNRGKENIPNKSEVLMLGCHGKKVKKLLLRKKGKIQVLHLVLRKFEENFEEKNLTRKSRRKTKNN